MYKRQVYIVTSLADDGAVGTLRHAIQQKGRRKMCIRDRSEVAKARLRILVR